jgi:HAD superfamily hydrolase (TIGR01549 family)
VPEIGVVFDCDGTLVDSEPLSGEAWRTVLDPFGYRITEEDERQVVGRTFSFTHAYLSERVDLPDAETTWAQVRTELFRLIDTRLEAFADAVGAVADLQVRGVRLAVASSSVRERLDRTLARAGLAFDISIAGDEVEHGKPAPDMFLRAAEAMGVDRRRCVVVEDSAPGVAAGRAAGMATLAVCRVKGTESALSQADRIVYSVSAEEIVSLLEHGERCMRGAGSRNLPER